MNFDDYENKLEYPKKPIKKCPNCNLSFKDIDNYCSACGQNLKFYNDLLEEYRKKLQIYNKKSCDLHDKFKHDALDDVGLLEHPKANQIFSFAYEHGHSSGFHDVYYWLSELAELFI